MPFQTDWKYCNRCQVLCYAGPDAPSAAPCGKAQGISHDFTGSGTYSVLYNDGTAPYQADWRFCVNCHALVFMGTPTVGLCPWGGNHQPLVPDQDRSPDQTFDYQVAGNFQPGWHWCTSCMALFYPQGSNMGHCSANNRNGHTPVPESKPYFLQFTP